jgi:AcrR family transcriptional regulator
LSSDALTPRAQEILEAARALLEEEGFDAFSMRRLAERLGIRAPSLYKHFASKEALEAALLSQVFAEQAQVAETAVRDTDEPLAAIARGYREYALRHPQLYRLFTERAIDRSLITPGAEARARAESDAASGGDVSLSRAVWGFAHGMTILELNNRFPPGADLEAAWERGLAAFTAAVRPPGEAPASAAKRQRTPRRRARSR